MWKPIRHQSWCGWTVAASRCPSIAVQKTNWKFSYAKNNTKRIFVLRFVTWTTMILAPTSALPKIRLESSKPSCIYKVIIVFFSFYTQNFIRRCWNRFWVRANSLEFQFLWVDSVVITKSTLNDFKFSNLWDFKMTRNFLMTNSRQIMFWWY